MDMFIEWLNSKLDRATRQRDEECNNLRLLNEDAFISRINKSNTPELIRSLSEEVSLLEEVKKMYEVNKC
ncbi:MAG: hypothetical protein RSF40_01415 [Oscillospiraceae bacterium]